MKRYATWTILLIGCLLTLIAGIAFGSSSLSFGDVYGVLVGRILSRNAADLDSPTMRIVWQLRMPRVILAFLVGGGLSIIGVAMQTLVRNPLAEPYLLGISSGASAGASLFYLGFLPAFLSTTLTLPLAAFLGGLLTILLVYAVARQGNQIEITRLILAGVAMAALMGAISTYATFASPELFKQKTVMFWLLGSFTGSQWHLIPLPAVACAIALISLMAFARPLDAMLTGEAAAAYLGVPVEAFKRYLLILAAFVTGLLVAAAGAIGFVGLIIPHAVRSVVGVLHRQVVPASFCAGGIFLVWADIAARTLIPAIELPIGVVTAFCGVPFFLYLLRRSPYRFGG